MPAKNLKFQTITAPKAAPKKTTDGLDLVQDYLEKDRRMAPYSVASIKRLIRQLINRYGVTAPSKELAYQIENDLHEKKRSDNTIRLYLHAIDCWYEAINDGHPIGGYDVYGKKIKTRKPKIRCYKMEYLKPAEVRQLLDSCTTRRNKAVIAVMAYCALRRKEVVNLNIRDVDLRGGWLHVRDNTSDSDVQFGGVKNHHQDEIVPIPPDCVTILADYMKELESIGILKTRAMFVTIKGTRFTLEGLGRLVNKIGEQAAIKRRDENGKEYMVSIHPHLLRHSCASTLAAAGLPVPDIQKILRHSTIVMTMRYVHSSPEEVKKRLNKVLMYG